MSPSRYSFMKAKVLFCYIKKNRQTPQESSIRNTLSTPTELKGACAESTEQTLVFCMVSNNDFKHHCQQAESFSQSQSVPHLHPTSDRSRRMGFLSATVIP